MEFIEGDYIHLKLRPCNQNSVVQRQITKLSLRFCGPYRILERVRLVAYRLDLLEVLAFFKRHVVMLPRTSSFPRLAPE